MLEKIRTSVPKSIDRLLRIVDSPDDATSLKAIHEHLLIAGLHETKVTHSGTVTFEPVKISRCYTEEDARLHKDAND